jgi:hypothetical protein
MVYTKDFEPILLGESQEYFISWADQESSTRGLASYVEECHKLIDRETSRCDMFGLDSSRRELLTAGRNFDQTQRRHPSQDRECLRAFKTRLY